MITSAQKRYLFAIYKLGENGNAVYSKDIAAALHVKRPSVSKMLDIPAQAGFIDKEYYGTVRLTKEGAVLANTLYTRYLLLHSFFTAHLGVPEDDAIADALVCLCDLSENSIERIAGFV